MAEDGLEGKAGGKGIKKEAGTGIRLRDVEVGARWGSRRRTDWRGI